jgi:hypothetical protein
MVCIASLSLTVSGVLGAAPLSDMNTEGTDESPLWEAMYVCQAPKHFNLQP